MDKDFKGDEVLMEKYKEITTDLPKIYKEGISICLAGSHGLGKTMLCCNILKRAAEKNYSATYTTLSDIVNATINGPHDEKYLARNQLLTVDFLTIDEFDPRWFSENGADLFGRILEDVFRNRVQNCLPLFLITNSPNITESLNPALKKSIQSLMNYVVMVPVLGVDYRKNGKKV